MFKDDKTTEILRAAAAKTDISPNLGVELCGYGRYLNRRSTAVHDHLYARAFIIEHAGTKVVILSCDLVGITRAITSAVRKRIVEDCHIDPSCVMIGCSHTHSGPATIPMIAWGAMDQDYINELEDRLVEVVKKANQQLCQAQLSFFQANVEPAIGCNRVDENLGTDPMVRGVFLSNDNQPIALIASHSCHPVILGSKNTETSGDFPGVAMQMLESKMPHLIAGFIQGASADINPKDRGLFGREGWDTVKQYACQFVGAIENALSSSIPIDNPKLCGRLGSVIIPLRVTNRNELTACLSLCSNKLHTLDPQSVDYKRTRFEIDAYNVLLAKCDNPSASHVTAELGVIGLGDIAFAALPGEAYYDLARTIAESSPFGHTIVFGLTNDALGYFPRSSDFNRPEYDDFGGYTAKATAKIFGQFPFESNVQDLLRNGIVQLLNSAYEE